MDDEVEWAYSRLSEAPPPTFSKISFPLFFIIFKKEYDFLVLKKAKNFYILIDFICSLINLFT